MNIWIQFFSWITPTNKLKRTQGPWQISSYHLKFIMKLKFCKTSCIVTSIMIKKNPKKLLKFCTEHGSMIVARCAQFQKESFPEAEAMDKQGLNLKWISFRCYRPRILTHFGLLMSHGNMNPGQHWCRWWLVAWWHQAITWTNVDLSSKVFYGIHLSIISQEVFMKRNLFLL